MNDQLYQDRIVALAKAKTGAGKIASPTKSARRDNPCAATASSST